MRRLTAELSRFHEDEAGMDTIEKVALIGAIAVPILILIYNFAEELKGMFASNKGEGSFWAG